LVTPRKIINDFVFESNSNIIIKFFTMQFFINNGTLLRTVKSFENRSIQDKGG